MKKINRVLNKVISVTLSAAILSSIGALGEMTGIEDNCTGVITVSAAENETPESSFQYEENNDGEIVITGFTGSETQVSIPSQINGRTVAHIGDYAFIGSAVTSVTIPDSVESIGCYAFEGCTGLTGITIPDAVKSIGSFAFEGCDGLTNAYIGNGIESIGESAFRSCTSLARLTTGNYLRSIGKYAFADCSKLTGVLIPESVTSIGEGAFYNCKALAGITVPQDVTDIGKSVFKNCTGLTRVTVMNSIVSDSEFSGCTGLKYITMGSSVSEIDNSAFYGCTAFTGITIPQGVVRIGAAAFSGCSKLTGITIPAAAAVIEVNAFADCGRLKSITTDENNTSYSSSDGILFDKDKTRLICFPAGKTGTCAVPDTVKSIDERAFYLCKNLSGISLPDGLTEIGEWAFTGCTGLTEIAIPDTVEEIGDHAFHGCSGLKALNVPQGITSVADYEFFACTGLAEISLPESITKIGSYAFGSCASLTVIEIPANTTYLSEHSFEYCTGLSSIEIPDCVTEIGDYAFSGCIGLNKISIPENVEKIGKKVFDSDKNVTIYGVPGSYVQTYAQQNNIPFSEMLPELENKCTVSKTSFTVGETVTVTGDAAGGSGAYTYEFYYKRTNAADWTRFGGASAASFRPGSAGSFLIRTCVSDGTDTTEKEFSLTAVAALQNRSTVSKTSFTAGETVTVTGAASGGSGAYTYEFYYKRANASNWTRFGSGSSARFAPSSAGSFVIRTYVKDSTGKAVRKDFELTAFAALQNISTVSKTSFTVGETVIVTGAASGGSGSYTYEFYYKRTNATGWTRFGSGSSARFAPSSAGSFVIRTYVKDSTGKAVRKEFSLTAA